MSLRGGRPFWMSGSCQEAPRKSRRPSRLSGGGRETLPDVRECLGDPPGCPGVPIGCLGAPTGCPILVDWPSWMSETGWEGIPDVR